MKINQRDIIEVAFKLPDDTFKPHPAIVLSNNYINELEGACICAMMSGNPTDDDYSFWIENLMVTKTPKKKSQVRCHLISLVPNSDIRQKFGEIKPQYFQQLIDKINTAVFADPE